MKTPLNSYLRQPTKYNEMIACLFAFIAPLPVQPRGILAKLYDDWNCVEASEFLNSACVTDATGAASQANQVIAWKLGGPRPQWLHTITDEDLATLS